MWESLYGQMQSAVFLMCFSNIPQLGGIVAFFFKKNITEQTKGIPLSVISMDTDLLCLVWPKSEHLEACAELHAFQNRTAQLCSINLQIMFRQGQLP